MKKWHCKLIQRRICICKEDAIRHKMIEQNPSIAQLGMAYDQNIREPDRFNSIHKNAQYKTDRRCEGHILTGSNTIREVREILFPIGKKTAEF